MGSVGDRDLVQELAEITVAQLAPDELAIFDETAADFFEDPEAVLDPDRRDEVVGFGLDAALVTPYVLAVAVPVVQFLVKAVADATKEEARTAIGGLVRRLFRRGQPAPHDRDGSASPALTAQQALQVRTIAYERAISLRLPESQARILADSVAGGVLAER